MLHFEVSVLPLIVIALVNFVFSWIWYSPIAPWFKAWQKGVGMPEGKVEMTEAEKKMMPVLMGGALFSSFALSYVLQVIVHSVGAVDFLQGLLVGLVIWVGFTLTHSLNTLFEGRKIGVLVINNFHYIITYAVFGGLVAIWR